MSSKWQQSKTIICLVLFLFFLFSLSCLARDQYHDYSQKNNTAYYGSIHYGNNQCHYYDHNGFTHQQHNIDISNPYTLILATPTMAKQFINLSKQAGSGVKSFFRKITGRDKREQEERERKEKEEEKKERNSKQKT